MFPPLQHRSVPGLALASLLGCRGGTRHTTQLLPAPGSCWGKSGKLHLPCTGKEKAGAGSGEGGPWAARAPPLFLPQLGRQSRQSQEGERGHDFPHTSSSRGSSSGRHLGWGRGPPMSPCCGNRGPSTDLAPGTATGAGDCGWGQGAHGCWRWGSELPLELGEV